MEKKNNVHANHRQRLKDRALKEGLDNFPPHNFLELLLFYALPQVDTNEIAHNLINHFGSLDAVFSASVEQLMKVDGIKAHAATFIKLIPEISRYYAIIHNEDADYTSTEGLREMIASHFVGVKEEIVVCAFFDRDDKLIEIQPMFKGDINSVSFSYREFVVEAMSKDAYKAVVAHNHPTGSPIPSPDDIDTLKRMKTELAKVNVDLTDGYVVANNQCVSINEFINKGNRDALL